MDTNKHTPGPWLAEYRNRLYFDIQAPAVGDERRGRVAEVCGNGGKDIATIRANALLIAAAPDLLAALQRLMGGTTDFDDALAANAQAKSAIVRATGA